MRALFKRTSAYGYAKAIRAGVPVLASKAAPTVQGIELAKKYRLTLITGVREDKLTVYKPEK